MRRNGSIWMLSATLACAAFPAPALAQQISEALIKELIKQAADPSARIPVIGESPQAVPAGANRPVVPMWIEDAVKLALDRNLDIAVQRLNPQISDIAVASIQSVYHPSLTSTLSDASTNGTPQNILQLSAGGQGTKDRKSVV